jgi:hypothetical protein
MGFSYSDDSALQSIRNRQMHASFITENSAVTPVTIAAQNTWTKSSGSYSKIADSNNWFTLSDNETGEITYDGPNDITVLISNHISCQIGLDHMQMDMKVNAASASALQHSFYISTYQSLNQYDVLELTPGDVLQLYVRNTTSAGNINMRQHSIFIRGL